MKKTPSSSSPYQLSILLHFFTLILSSALSSPSLLRGVHPLDFKYYSSEVIKCKDELSSFTKDRLNDDFCDCLDGTDEPGTSACPRSKFYCKNMGSQPRFLFSSRVNDNICDCCDGTDEYDGTTYCPNTCIMGSSIEYKAQSHNTTHPNTLQANKERQNGRLEDVMHNLKDLKVLAIIQLIIIAFWAILLFHRRLKSRRQRFRS